MEFTGVNPLGMLGEHDFGSWFTSFSRVLSTSQVGYHAGKPIESVVYCFYKLTLGFLWVYRHNKPQVFNQSERAYYLSFFFIKMNERSYALVHYIVLILI